MYCVRDLFASYLCNVFSVAYIVERRWAEVPSIDTVSCPCRSFAWFFMDNDFVPGGASGTLLKLKVTFSCSSADFRMLSLDV